MCSIWNCASVRASPKSATLEHQFASIKMLSLLLSRSCKAERPIMRIPLVYFCEMQLVYGETVVLQNLDGQITVHVALGVHLHHAFRNVQQML